MTSMNLPAISKRRLVAYLFVLVLLVNMRAITQPVDFLSLTVVHIGLLWGMAALGLNLLVRYTGLGSFGHALFFGSGAYTVALLANYYGTTQVFVMLLAGALVATVIGVVAGYLSRQYTGLVFGLFTLALGQLALGVVKGNQLFGGTTGLAVRPGEIPNPKILGIVFEPSMYRFVLYQLSLAFLVLGLIVMWRMGNSPFGSALDSIGDNRLRARMIGIPVERYVTIAMTISALYGGLAGAMWAVTIQHVRPSQVLPFFRSGEMLFMVILGGVNTLVGPVVGGLVLHVILSQTKLFFDNPSPYIGVFLVLSVFLFPHGIVGTFNYQNVATQVRKTRENPGRVLQAPRLVVAVARNRIGARLNGIEDLFGRGK